GRPTPDTILTGIGELVRRGYWPLAIIVLFASVLVPGLKLVSLTWFVVAVRQRWRWALVFRTRLYRLVDGSGRWSNIDVFMISLLVALVQFGVLATVEPKAGAVAFAAVVIVTMFAAEAFDPRLMWDAVEGRTNDRGPRGAHPAAPVRAHLAGADRRGGDRRLAGVEDLPPAQAPTHHHLRERPRGRSEVH